MHNNNVEWEFGRTDDFITFSCNSIILFTVERIDKITFKIMNKLHDLDIKYIKQHAPVYKNVSDPVRKIISDFAKGKINRFQ